MCKASTLLTALSPLPPWLRTFSAMIIPVGVGEPFGKLKNMPGEMEIGAISAF